jgi:arylsulfatase A-like enzyme
MHTLRFAAFLALILPALSGCAGEPHPRHFVLITVDTLRADRLGCYGGPHPTSPRIDQLAAEGALFVDAYTPRSSTLPAMVSFFTSRYPIEHGVLRNDQQVPETELTLAEILRDAGFRCRAFVANQVLMPGQTDFEQGFDPDRYAFVPDEREMTDQAIAHIRSSFTSEQREFLWIHYMNPHRPYEPPSPYDRMFDVDYEGPYDGSRDCTDRIFIEKIALSERDRGHIEAALEATGQADQTLIIFAADHGEDLYSHNCYFYHANSIYRSSTRVPLILRLPGRIRAGQRIEGLAEILDVLPTALGLLGVDTGGIDECSSWHGIDLGPALGGQPLERAYAFAQWSERIFSLRGREWMYVSNPDCIQPRGSPQAGSYPIGAEELYRVPYDPDEQRNVIAEHPSLAGDMKRALDAMMSGFASPDHPAESIIDPGQLERLRSLGYIR